MSEITAGLRKWVATTWDEIEPFVTHSLVVLVMIGATLLTGKAILELDQMFPGHDRLLATVETLEVWTVTSLTSMFCLYAIVRVLIRLYQGVVEACREK